MRISNLKTNPALEKSGAWVPWVGDVRLRLRRTGNADYQRALVEGLRPHRALVRADALPIETMEAIHRSALARHVLVGWENLTDDQDQPIAYSQETAERLLADPALHDLYEFVIVAAARMETFRAEEAQEDLGNLPRSSNGIAPSTDSRSNSAPLPAKAVELPPSTSGPRSMLAWFRRGTRSPKSTILSSR